MDERDAPGLRTIIIMQGFLLNQSLNSRVYVKLYKLDELVPCEFFRLQKLKSERTRVDE